LKQEYDFEVHHAPFLLRPETPPEGMPARRVVPMDDPSTAMEQRGERLGIKFSRGRTWSSNSHLALEASEYVFQNTDRGWDYSKRLFQSYFTDLEDISDIEVLLKAADDVGVDRDALKASLDERRYEAEVDAGIAWSREIDVTAIPTFVFNERTGMVGAQELPAFREMMRRVGNEPKDS
jgi:predicted DsbA family dithiol-disulfide isomerase